MRPSGLISDIWLARGRIESFVATDRRDGLCERRLILAAHSRFAVSTAQSARVTDIALFKDELTQGFSRLIRGAAVKFHERVDGILASSVGGSRFSRLFAASTYRRVRYRLVLDWDVRRMRAVGVHPAAVEA